MSTVREATLKDLKDIMVLGKEFAEEAPNQYEWEEAKVHQVLHNLIEDPNGCILVLEVDNKIVGAILFSVNQMLFTSELIAAELAWFVNKEYRGKASSTKLIKEYERMCKEVGITKVLMSDITGLQELNTLYTKLGYAKVETTYIKEL